ncbi:di-heme oxidoredictase family protein [Celeribacter arenosi]|uniref:Di-heme oxidoredictase family protein n=1 Tax=Celeribacter arenosi TaxID=792649 RepID=A0ABP7JYJ0_9RHOB
MFKPALFPMSSIFAAAMMASSALAGVLDEPHLDIVPRTPEEAARIAAVTAMPVDFTAPAAFEEMSAGAATVRATDVRDVFSHASENLGFDEELTFKLGNGLFKKVWVSSPSSTLASDGLGPIYNARSCQRCHLKDGRGHPPSGPDDSATSIFLRVSIPGKPEDGIAEIEDYIATLPDPVYGSQLQDESVAGVPAEYRFEVAYQEVQVALSGGEVAQLRVPSYRAANLGYGPLHAEAMLSPRVAPQMIGLGLVEAIPAADIIANADPDDVNGDGISGRANVVWSTEFDQPMLGRFGHKAGQPTITEQSAAAFSGDIGISSSLFPAGAGECTVMQTACQSATHGDGDVREFEIDDEGLDLVTFYSRNLGVPARRDVGDPQVLRGKEVFYDTGCAACHQPKFVTNRLADGGAQSFQLIWPYSDFLLHDMGEGLADHRPEARATGREWRTAPLWGIGLTEQVSGHTFFLHDGRARSLLEAVLWHGGEAEVARDAVVDMLPEDRDALIRFLESL